MTDDQLKAAKSKIPYPLTEDERREQQLDPEYRKANAPPVGTWERDGWDIMRDWKMGDFLRKNPPADLDNRWEPKSPFSDNEFSRD